MDERNYCTVVLGKKVDGKYPWVGPLVEGGRMHVRTEIIDYSDRRIVVVQQIENGMPLVLVPGYVLFPPGIYEKDGKDYAHLEHIEESENEGITALIRRLGFKGEVTINIPFEQIIEDAVDDAFREVYPDDDFI